MNDREKLVELIAKIQDYGYKTVYEENVMYMRTITAEKLADYLLTHGVTVKEPLTVENLIFFNWEIWREWWIELKSGRLFCAKERIGYIRMTKDEYGKTWRCWKEKPSEAERQAAEWEK